MRGCLRISPRSLTSDLAGYEGRSPGLGHRGLLEARGVLGRENPAGRCWGVSGDRLPQRSLQLVKVPVGMGDGEDTWQGLLGRQVKPQVAFPAPGREDSRLPEET